MSLKLEELTGKIIESAINVHKKLGSVELKTVKEFDDSHLAQVISYLKAAKLKAGLLLNFSKSVLKIKRVMN